MLFLIQSFSLIAASRFSDSDAKPTTSFNKSFSSIKSELCCNPRNLGSLLDKFSVRF